MYVVFHIIRIIISLAFILISIFAMRSASSTYEASLACTMILGMSLLLFAIADMKENG